MLHVAEAFGGGLLEVVRIIAERCAADGSPQTIAWARRPETPADPRTVIGEPVGLVELDWRRKAPRTQLAVAARLRRLADELAPDVVHLHSSFAGCVGAYALAGRVPVIFTPHAFASARPGAGLARRAFAAGERYAVRRCDVVGAVSESEAAEARARGARRVVTIPNGIEELDDPRGSGAAAGTGSPRVIALGRIIAQRRPEATGAILGRIADLADVAWIGGGGAPGSAGAQARAALTAAGVPVTEWMPREQALGELAAATAYLHWTAWDGMPLAILEAMARDTIVVASDIAPNRELLDPRQVCRTEDEAAAVLRRIITDPAFARELLAAQHARRVHHSARAMAAGWADLYGSLT